MSQFDNIIFKIKNFRMFLEEIYNNQKKKRSTGYGFNF